METKISFCLAGNEELLKKAAVLLNKEYAKDGYVDLLAESEIEISKYCKLPNTKTFVAMLNEQVVATVSVVEYGQMGLPMQSIYKDELQSIVESSEGKLAEISQLAIDRELGERLGISQRKIQTLILPELFRLIFYYVAMQNLEVLCIVINPKHDSFYAALGFESIGELKYYPNVKNAPALPRILKVADVLNEGSDNMLSRMVLARPIESAVLKKILDAEQCWEIAL